MSFRAATALCLLALACQAPATLPPDQLTDPTLPSSLCTVTAVRADCPHQTLTVSLSEAREVHWQTPRGEAPSGGWPTVLLFQGSTVSAEKTWGATTTDGFGGFFQTLTVKRLLDDGFTVITPEARGDGSTWWDTNQVAWAGNWAAAPDAALMTALFERIEAGDFGPVDTARLYAGGISSGGYMTSRMALSYPGRFKALAIQSASWATCGGIFCALPATLPKDHAPTLFLHGKNDAIVPYGTMTPYEAQLRAEGHQTRLVSSETAGHEWLPESPAEVADWFAAHP